MGRMYCTRADNEGLKIYNNPLGVMTNSPEFNWHLQNLRQYIGLKSQPYAPTQWGIYH